MLEHFEVATGGSQPSDVEQVDQGAGAIIEQGLPMGLDISRISGDVGYKLVMPDPLEASGTDSLPLVDADITVTPNERKSSLLATAITLEAALVVAGAMILTPKQRREGRVSPRQAKQYAQNHTDGGNGPKPPKPPKVKKTKEGK